MYYADGSVYEGEWYNDLRNGEGMLRLGKVEMVKLISTFCLIRKNLCFKPACSMPSWEKSCKIIIFSLRLYLILNQNFLGYNR